MDPDVFLHQEVHTLTSELLIELLMMEPGP